MQDEILKKMMCCEADLGEIANLIQILKNCTENDSDAEYLCGFVEIIQLKIEKFTDKYEEFNSEIWKIVNKYNPEFI